jgi:protocatechuate 3,4-dioxygenase, alpha subunit
MAELIYTPSQTVGPFYGSALIWDGSGESVPADDPNAVEIHGRLADGEGPFVYPEGLVEVWAGDQFARVQTDANGDFRVRLGRTVDGVNAPHFNVHVFGRGLLKPLLTRMYFSDQEAANARDPLLRVVPESRRPSLIARREADGVFRFDICVQGPDEGVFFRP